MIRKGLKMVGNRQFVDSDLKSLGGFHRAGSIPALGTKNIDTLSDIGLVL